VQQPFQSEVGQQHRWLTPGAPSRPPLDLLRPFPAEQMTAWKVDRKVGNVKNDMPDCIEPMAEPDERAPGLFNSVG
jgi:putative SOS response-associated peptidase YedK